MNDSRFMSIDEPDEYDESGNRIHRGYTEREMTALDIAEIDLNLVCVDPICVVSYESPHMKTSECPLYDEWGKGTEFYRKYIGDNPPG